MQTKANALKEAIVLLENKRALELELLKDQLHVTYESLKPINQIKSMFHSGITSTESGNSVLDTAIGLTTGYLSKKILIGGSINPVTRVLGVLLQTIVANVAAKHSGTIKEAGGALLDRIFKNGHQVKENLE